MNIFQEPNGDYSSKRVVGIIGAVVLIASLILSHFTELKPTEFQFEAVALLVAACLGFTSIEKFKKDK